MPGNATAVLIDMQEDVVHGRWWTWWPEIDDVVTRCVQLVNACRERAIPVIYTAVEYKSDGSNTPQAVATGTATPTEYLVQGTPGTAIVPELSPAPGELLAIKNLVSAFDAEGFGEAMEARAVDTILLAGLAVEGGINATVRDAHARGIQVILVADGCAAFSQSSYEEHIGQIFPPLATILSLENALVAVA
jgi:maleamate amidohydrolase